MRLLAACWLTHVLLAQVMPSPWWVPDVTLVGLVLSVTRSPSRWLLLSWLAGCSTLLWAVRYPAPLMAGAVAVGGSVRLLTAAWDAADARIQYLVMGLASGLTTLGAVWLEGCWSLSLLGLAAMHVLLTCLAFVILRRWLVTTGAG